MNLSIAHLLYISTSKDYRSKDYYPGGMVMPDRNFSSVNYRYSINGQEKVDEISGAGNHKTALFWEYDTRLGRRWNSDPVVKPWESSYACFSNNPILVTDVNGDDGNDPIKVKKGDNLSTIAKNNKTNVADLLKANPNIKDPNKIYPGQNINLP